MGLLSFTKEELRILSLSVRQASIKEKIEYMIEHFERQEKTAARFEEWNRQLLDPKV